MLWYTVHTSVLMTAQYSTEQFCKSLPPPPPPVILQTVITTRMSAAW